MRGRRKPIPRGRGGQWGWERLGGRADLESGNDFAGHGGVEGVELLGAVQLDGADAVDVVEEDVVGVVAGLFFGYIGCGRSFSHLCPVSAPLLPDQRRIICYYLCCLRGERWVLYFRFERHDDG